MGGNEYPGIESTPYIQSGSEFYMDRRGELSGGLHGIKEKLLSCQWEVTE